MLLLASISTPVNLILPRVFARLMVVPSFDAAIFDDAANSFLSIVSGELFSICSRLPQSLRNNLRKERPTRFHTAPCLFCFVVEAGGRGVCLCIPSFICISLACAGSSNLKRWHLHLQPHLLRTSGERWTCAWRPGFSRMMWHGFLSCLPRTEAIHIRKQT